MGSTGVGFTVDRGVVATVTPATKTTIVFNGKKITFPTVVSVLRSLTKKPVAVVLKSEFPLACGFGISGASAWATAYGVNKLLNLGKSKEGLLAICHRAEIENKTGLGTVGTQATGGFLLKNHPGIPVECTKFPFEKMKLYSVVLGKLPTKKVLSDPASVAQINISADKALRRITSTTEMTLKHIISIAKNFSYESGLANKKIKEVIEHIEDAGGFGCMHMIGYSVLSTIPDGLKKYGTVYELTVTNSAVRLL